MESVAERLNKLREERIAREKARIEKLRELNLKKYNKTDPPKNSLSNLSLANRPAKNELANSKPKLPLNGIKRPTTAPDLKKTSTKDIKQNSLNDKKTISKEIKQIIPIKKTTKEVTKNITNKIQTKVETNLNKQPDSKIPTKTKNDIIERNKTEFKVRKSLAAPKLNTIKLPTRKSMIPKLPEHRESVFERLYKPKVTQNDDIKKLKTDPNYLKKVISNTGLILDQKPVRRSISAVHFKRINKNELTNCIHKWASIGDKLNKVHLKNIDEDENVTQDKVISAIKSERKKVKFMTPVPQNYNTPRPEELQARLKSWLQKRGKSLDSYHHLQCFGINHLTLPQIPHIDFEDENKENIALDSDSDDGSYSEMQVKDLNNWRRVSNVSESVDFNESADSTLTSEAFNVNEVLLGALNDLTDLLKEGFDWEQSARWLRAIRERFPDASNTAAYWECRAALEERRGDLPASVQCWEEAIAKGTEHSVVEANLDHLLDKFMQLKISPNSGKRRCVDPKMVDVKNVFKSTIIRFAVQQAKLRKSEVAKFTVTPVRRSGRLSMRTPLAECSSIRKLASDHMFIPNPTICQTP